MMIFHKNKESLTVKKDLNNNIPDFARRKKTFKRECRKKSVNI